MKYVNELKREKTIINKCQMFKSYILFDEVYNENCKPFLYTFSFHFTSDILKIFIGGIKWKIARKN